MPIRNAVRSQQDLRLADVSEDRRHRKAVRVAHGNRASAVAQRARWKLRCDCGQMYETSYQSLRSGSAKSCGCLRRNPQYRPPSKIPEKGKCHPFVRAIWVRIADEQAYQKEVAKRSGIHEATIRQWRERRAPLIKMGRGMSQLRAMIEGK